MDQNLAKQMPPGSYSPAGYDKLMDYLPVPIWEEDFSAVKLFLGRQDIPQDISPEEWLKKHPAIVDHCISLVRVSRVNQASVVLFGAADRSDLEGGILTEGLTRETLDAFRKEFAAIIRGDSSLDFESSIRRLDGTVRNVQIRWLVMPGHTMALDRVLVVIQDITDRYRAAETERQGQQRLRQIIDLVPHMIYAKDLQGKIHLANQALADTLGTSVDELVGKSMADFYDRKSDLMKWKDEDEEVILTGDQMIMPEEEFLDAEGNVRIFHTTKIPFTESGSNEEVLLGVSLDITQRKAQEKELENYLAILKGVIDSSPEGIVVVNVEGEIVHYNTLYKEIWGLPDSYNGESMDEMGVDYFSAQLVNPDVLKKMVGDMKSHPGKKIIDLLEFRDGRIYMTQARHYMMGDSYGGRVWFFQDITERRMTENELLERNFELDSFVYRASHDLKAPLNSIMGLIELAKMEQDQSPAMNQYLDLMDRSVKKLDSFIRNLADFSSNRSVSGGRDLIRFDNLIAETIENVQTALDAQNIGFITKIDGDGRFRSDPVRLKVILDNLISNAVKYRHLDREDAEVKVKVTYTPEHAQIIVSDNGIGLGESEQEKVFRMFYRAHVQAYGAGLGLYIVRQAVDQLGGTISLQSKPGHGSKFIIEIPGG